LGSARSPSSLSFSALARIMHQIERFCTSSRVSRSSDPIGWIGVQQLAVQHVWS
jgi:hypothetical protein